LGAAIQCSPVSARIVQFKLNRMSSHVDAFNFSTLQVDITLNHVFSKYAATGQELVVFL